MAKGLHQVFVSKLMTLIGTILLTISSVVVLVIAAASISPEADLSGAMSGFAGATLAGLVLFFVSLALLLLGLIFMMVGLGNASKDDDRFKTVLVFALISLGCTIFSAFIPYIPAIYLNVPVLSQILNLVSTVLDLLVVIMTITYTCDALAAKGRNDLAEKGANILKLILVIIIILLIVRIVVIFPVPIAAILSIVALVLQIVYWFSFMIFLSKASKALA